MMMLHLGLFEIFKFYQLQNDLYRLDDEARTMLVGLGSKKAKTLSFRDNWIFVGGKSLEEPHEAVSKSIFKIC